MTDTASSASQCSAHSAPQPRLPERITGLDTLRGFAAVAVIFYHFHALLALEMWPAWTGYFSMAVPLFFALSAFSLCLRYSGRLGVTDTVGNFYWRRYLRIAPLFYLMLFAYIARRIIKGWSLPPVEDILLNLTFLFPFDPAKNESLVAAGWSLGLEMIFYAMFPLIVARTTSLKRALVFFVAAVLVQAASGYVFFRILPETNFYWLSFPTQFAFFAGGILAYHSYLGVRSMDASATSLVTGVLLASSALALVFGTRHGLFEVRVGGWPALRPLIGFILTVMVVALALKPFPVLVNRVTVFLGEISYGLYLIHPFVILVIGKPLFTALGEAGFSRPDAASITIAAVLLVTGVAATASFYWLEQPMMKLHRFVRRRPVASRP
ncbi:acyltransferase [Limibaculum sp. FT325]|uniref:acyltransferase family protein n=1 Tax=Thermohalobaculum sediminis TaxID=2939436 RepID=UPI0020C0D504|nr:acyltransferase [Limibaculum sediminis]MCL5777442.1 acyltransferase [Limibaculum sediminis]